MDASSSWGISLVVGTYWAAWRLVPGWNGDGHNIGWAEGIALELAVNWLCSKKYHNVDIIVQSDNSGVIGAFWKGCSHNVSHNDSISQISISLSLSNLSLSPIFIPSLANCADPVSQGCLGPLSSHIPDTIFLPPVLCPYLIHV